MRVHISIIRYSGLVAAFGVLSLLAGCASFPRTLPDPALGSVAVDVQRCDIPCAVRVSCPPVLSFNDGAPVQKSVYQYDGKPLIEHVFQKAMRQRYLPASYGAAGACVAAIKVHELRLAIKGSSATCTARILCMLRDYQGTIIFKKLFEAVKRSSFDGSSVPQAVGDAVVSTAKQFVLEISSDPIVANSMCGCQKSHRRARPQPREKHRIAVLPMSKDAKLEQIDEMFITAFAEMGRYEVLTASDRDQVIREHHWAIDEMVDPDEGQAIELGKMLAARYLIIGSCGFLAGEVSINVRVIDGQTGQAIAAESAVAPHEARYLLNTVKLVAEKLSAKWDAAQNGQR